MDLQVELQPSLRLLAACCRWPDGSGRRDAVREAAQNVDDWEAACELAGAHRVEGLVAHALAVSDVDLPEFVQQWREEARQRVSVNALTQVRDTLRIAAEFDRAGIPFRVLKGIPLGVAAFGTASIKQSWDLDLLVHPHHAVVAAERLAALGYDCIKPPRALTEAEFQRWSQVAKDAEFHAAGCAPVELHWSLMDLPWVVSDLDASTPARSVALLGEAAVPTFADHPNLAYMAVHGAAAGWSRLKWIADFAALLSAQADEAAAVAAARPHRVGPALDAALLLRHWLFGDSPPEGSRPNSDARRLAELGLTALRLRSPASAIEADPAALAAIRRSRRLLMPNLTSQMVFAVQRLRGLEDRRVLPLPPGLQWAYWPLRPLTFAWRRLRDRSSTDA